ncbi:PAS domain-containing protein [Shewanella profunda]|uniref:PAS domain-containing protein n=1 Tax=Shewanella profunda TaxID=254793 RepID=UPI00200BF7FB|nr:PAS domain-containing protein [Shewanella profunda]MCL1091776.1 PAS domain-containing protein [Shewanella profunda]
MEKNSISEPQTPLTQWQNSLPFKFSLIQLIIASILIFSTTWIMLRIQNQQITEQQAVLNQNHGQIVIAKLQEMTSQVENLVNAIANIAKLYRYDHDQLSRTIPTLLTVENQKDIISGGGIWPEPSAFNQQKFRDSLFWSRNIHDELIKIDTYNDDAYPSYHTEEWYRPTRYFPAGKTFWSKSYIDPTTKEPMITASGAMWMEHQFIGAATADIGLEKLNMLLRNAMAEISGYVIVLDHNNQVLVYPHSKNHDVAQDQAPNTLLTFDDLTKQHSSFDPLALALNTADRTFVTQAIAERVFTQDQMDNLTRLTADNEREMLIAIVNNNARNHFTTPKQLASVSLATDPILNTPALASIFLMPNTYWKILIVTPVAPLQDTAKHLVEQVGIYLVCIQLVGLILLFLLQHRLIITPIMKMVEALKRNDPTAIELKAKQRHDEIGLLAKTLLSRTQQLEVAMASLDASNLALEQQLETLQLFQQELNHHKEQLRSLLKFSQNLIYIKDLSGKYILVNDKYCEVLGIERRRIIGASDFELFQSQLAQTYQKNDRRVTHNQDAIHFEELIPTPHGHQTYQMTKFDIRDDEDNSIAVGAIGFNMDLKKRQEQEQEKLFQNQASYLQKQQSKIQIVNDDNNALRQQLALLNKELDMQYQLSLSKAQSQKLMQNFLAEVMTQMMQEQDRLLAQICQTQADSNNEYLIAITDRVTVQAKRLRHIAQLFNAHQSDIRPLHLAQFMRQLLDLLQMQLTRANVTVHLRCDENLIVDGSSWQYLQLFYRLLSNTLNHAFKTHQQTREINIHFRRESNKLQVTLDDNGVGMTEQQLSQLQQEMAQGLCLGTLTCLNLWIRNDLKGQLTVQSKLNKGTQIHCRWPL